jgi:hypothetical protein
MQRDPNLGIDELSDELKEVISNRRNREETKVDVKM